MAQEHQSARQRRCVMCGAIGLQAVTRHEEFEVDDPRLGKVTVLADNVPVEVCSACGETYSSPETGRIRDAAICHALGLLTPGEVRAVREQLQLSTLELAHVTGIGEETLVQWECGRLIPDRALDHYLRLLAAHPEHLPFLAQLPEVVGNGKQRAAQDGQSELIASSRSS
jgi:putative zinc finger/helix-turn-helix YgiT family protein